MKSLLHLPLSAGLLLFSCFTPAHALHEGKRQVLLVGDSTTEAKIPKMLRPQAPTLKT
ncbi:hypothetical protein [Verrucomicrobium spinosum]|uniref:hypothetical protein n=1 Tax=Verrucomicrobium spinosum TaxID=2736 RepID=UPI00155D9897|nr:hypothetical protein [Verrucomicrobium spinosum]